IDPAFHGQNGYKKLQTLFTDIFTPFLRNYFECKEVSEYIHEYWNGRLTVHTNGKKGFLSTIE
ncbi:MAG: hypothetical protein KDC37_04450, partial [Flavobacteriales bacterium]|nr:hypothetical protein [Flavobacteriales bacterium]